MSSDVGMPQMDGYELVRELRQRDRTPALPAIALTGHGRAEDVKQAFAAEFLAHVDKPVDFEHMKSVIATVMGAARASRSSNSLSAKTEACELSRATKRRPAPAHEGALCGGCLARQGRSSSRPICRL